MAEEYRKRGDEESLHSALTYHNMELDVCREIDSVNSAILALRCLGDCYRDLGDIQEAKPYYHDALALNRQKCKHVDDLQQEHACLPKGTALLARLILSGRVRARVLLFVQRCVQTSGILSIPVQSRTDLSERSHCSVSGSSLVGKGHRTGAVRRV